MTEFDGTTPPAFDPTSWTAAQLAHFGPVVGGTQLVTLLGYRTNDAFEKALAKNQLGVPVFRLGVRRGWYAMTVEVCDWLIKARASARTP